MQDLWKGFPFRPHSIKFVNSKTYSCKLFLFIIDQFDILPELKKKKKIDWCTLKLKHTYLYRDIKYIQNPLF